MKSTIVHNYHRKNLFSIVAPIKPCETIEDEDNNECNVWTSGHEGYLLNTGLLTDKKTTISYPSVSALIMDFATSPFDPTR